MLLMKAEENIRMTNNQFKAFIRLLINALEDVKNEPNNDKRDMKLEEILATLRVSIED